MGRPTFTAGEATRAPWLNVKGELCHEYDTRGNHRITINGAVGDWAGYAEVATFKLGDRLFMATTDHWLGELDEMYEAQIVVPRKLSDGYRDG